MCRSVDGIASKRPILIYKISDKDDDPGMGIGSAWYDTYCVAEYLEKNLKI